MSAARFREPLPPSTNTQMRIGPWRCADATWVSAVGLARRGVPTQSPRISVLLHLAIAWSVEHGRCDAPGHSAKTSKVKNVSLDAPGRLGKRAKEQQQQSL